MAEEMGNNEGNVEDTLKQRGSVYGSYMNVLRTRNRILTAIEDHYYMVNGDRMDREMTIGFSDTILKLVRAASNPKYKDSWHDLQGYAKLMEDTYGQDS